MRTVKFDRPAVAIIGGSGFYEIPDMRHTKEIRVETPYSDVLGIQVGTLGKTQVAFLSRHGSGHRLPPHKINYRANIWALQKIGVQRIIALNAVGGISSTMKPGSLVLPDQIIDYTYGRDHTFADLLSDQFNHVDFTYPFSSSLREALAEVLCDMGKGPLSHAVYACTQGPRLESAAEINRLAKDDCDIVGMTGMPEAALARELGLDYAMLCMVVNWGAGKSSTPITLEQIHEIIDEVNPVIRSALLNYFSRV